MSGNDLTFEWDEGNKMINIVVFLWNLAVELKHVLPGETVVNLSQSVGVCQRHSFQRRIKGGGELLELRQCVTCTRNLTSLLV